MLCAVLDDPGPPPADEDRVERSIALAERLLVAAERGITKDERRQQERLGALVADPARRLDRAPPFLQRGLEIDREQPGTGRHRQARDLDAAEAVPATELDAAAKRLPRREHPATHVFTIAEAAQGLGFQLG